MPRRAAASSTSAALPNLRWLAPQQRGIPAPGADLAAYLQARATFWQQQVTRHPCPASIDGEWPLPAEVAQALNQLVAVVRQTPEDPHDLLPAIERLLRSPAEPTSPATKLIALAKDVIVPAGTALLFPELSIAASTLKHALKALARDVDQRFDSDGTPHAAGWHETLTFWRLMASLLWTSRIANEEWLDPDLRRLLQAGCRQSALVVSRTSDTQGLLDAAELLGVGTTTVPLACLQPPGKPPRQTAKSRINPPSPATCGASQSDWSRLGILRNSPASYSDALVAGYATSEPLVRLEGFGLPLLDGTWTLQVQVGEQPVELAPEWSAICWNSDEDGDYLELQMRGPRGLYFERQLFLCRHDHWALLGDNIRGARGTATVVESRLPLAAGVTATAETETREIRLSRDGKTVARVWPLRLPQFRVHDTPHRCQADAAAITLRYQFSGQGNYAPVLIDWNPARLKGEAQWTALTVTENQAIVTPDRGAAYWLQSNSLRVFLYRSLKATPHARAALGFHTHRETAIAKVSAEGDVEPLLLVE